MEQARAVLASRFGYDAFRPGQEAVVSALLAGRDVLAVMPTGAGKSVCYQVPGRRHGGHGALVVSPLVSLMADQVRAVQEAGIRGAYLNSTLTPGQQAEVLRRAGRGRLRPHVRGSRAPGRSALRRVRPYGAARARSPWTRPIACPNGARTSAPRTFPSASSSPSCPSARPWRRSRPRPPTSVRRDIVRLLGLHRRGLSPSRASTARTCASPWNGASPSRSWRAWTSSSTSDGPSRASSTAPSGRRWRRSATTCASGASRPRVTTRGSWPRSASATSGPS